MRCLGRLAKIRAVTRRPERVGQNASARSKGAGGGPLRMDTRRGGSCTPLRPRSRQDPRPAPYLAFLEMRRLAPRVGGLTNPVCVLKVTSHMRRSMAEYLWPCSPAPRSLVVWLGARPRSARSAQRWCPASCCLWSARISFGVIPKRRLKRRLKCERSPKPASNAISVMDHVA